MLKEKCAYSNRHTFPLAFLSRFDDFIVEDSRYSQKCYEYRALVLSSVLQVVSLVVAWSHLCFFLKMACVDQHRIDRYEEMGWRCGNPRWTTRDQGFLQECILIMSWSCQVETGETVPIRIGTHYPLQFLIFEKVTKCSHSNRIDVACVENFDYCIWNSWF